MKTHSNRYLVRIFWSDDDEAYVAQVPALPGCVAHGSTFKQAAREIESAMAVWLDSAHRHNDPIPEPDLAREEISRVEAFLNVSKLAARAGLNKHTLASKLRRKSAFTAPEAKAILRALEPA
jgi:predicted RNase H-like HicB family nuclease